MNDVMCSSTLMYLFPEAVELSFALRVRCITLCMLKVTVKFLYLYLYHYISFVCRVILHACHGHARLRLSRWTQAIQSTYQWIQVTFTWANNISSFSSLLEKTTLFLLEINILNGTHLECSLCSRKTLVGFPDSGKPFCSKVLDGHCYVRKTQ